MRFNYVNENELDTPKNVLLKEGDATFFIKQARDKDERGNPLFTQKGDQKMDIMLVCQDSDGRQGNVFDVITENTAWKIKGILDAIGKPHLYSAAGDLNPLELEGQSGYCELSTRKSPGYDDRTQVKKYKPRAAGGNTPPLVATPDIEDDNLPF